MKFLLPLIVCFFGLSAQGQDTTSRIITLNQLFKLTEANAKILEVSYQNIGINGAKIDVAKADRLPEINTSVEAGYLSTISILKPSFAFYKNVPTPHFDNNYYLEANEVLFKGGFVRQNIARAKLAEELASANFEKDKQDVKLILLGKYLDLYQLYNSRIIFLKNIRLAEKRLNDLKSLRQQGLVTGNDLIRSELQISDFKLDLQHVDNKITILNNDLCIDLGIGSTTRILPDTTLVNTLIQEKPLEDYLQSAYQSQPQMKAAAINEKISEKSLALEKSTRFPTLSIYAGDALQRPFLLTLEPLDIYYNAYQFGLKLQYHISSIYHAKDKIRLANLELMQQRVKSEYQKQQTNIEVNTAYVNFKEAREDFFTLTKSLELADDNFRVVEKKYLHQLAQITDILDASTAKLAVELRLNNARINIINQWYRLQKAGGNF